MGVVESRVVLRDRAPLAPNYTDGRTLTRRRIECSIDRAVDDARLKTVVSVAK